jgi:hypothetical protein
MTFPAKTTPAKWKSTGTTPEIFHPKRRSIPQKEIRSGFENSVIFRHQNPHHKRPGDLQPAEIVQLEDRRYL